MKQTNKESMLNVRLHMDERLIINKLAEQACLDKLTEIEHGNTNN